MDAERLARLERLVERQDITDCLTRFSRGMDRFDRELFLSAFHPDATIAAGDFVGGPSRPVRLGARHARAGPDRDAAQLLLNHTCDIDGDTAHTETYYLFAARNRDESNWLAGAATSTGSNAAPADGGSRCAPTSSNGPGLVPTMPIPFADVPGIAANGRPARDRTDPSYTRPLTNHREVTDPRA